MASGGSLPLLLAPAALASGGSLALLLAPCRLLPLPLASGAALPLLLVCTAPGLLCLLGRTATLPSLSSLSGLGPLLRLLGAVLLSIPLAAKTDGSVLTGRRQDPLDPIRLGSDGFE